MVAKLKTTLQRISLAILIVVMTLFLTYMLLRNNIHAVTPGMVYRSAQLSPSRLKRLIEDDGIRTIINLRGANPQFEWYQDELSVARSMGVQHYDIKLSSTHLPTNKQLKRLVQLLEIAPKPILLHCQGGADRTGFASAVWLLLQGYPLTEAEQAFSILYFVHRSDSIGKQFTPIYRRWLKQHHFKTNAVHFKNWITTVRLDRS